MKKKDFDVIIIGAGASGAAAAWNLSTTNLKILCLEQGPVIKKKSYSFFQKDWEVLKQKKFNSDPNIRKGKNDYPINNDNSCISVANFNAVGGSTILYSGHFPRLHLSDFRTRSLENVGKDWPLNYYDLEPFYKLNDKMMGVAGLGGDPEYPNIKNMMPPVEIGSSGQKIAKAFNKLKWHWWPSYSAISTEKKNGRKKNSRSEVNITYWPKALSNGVKLRSNCRVEKITLDKKGKANGVIFFNEKNQKKFQKAKLIIMACSGIGTPRLLFNSANKFYPNGLSNSSGVLGKNLMFHPLGYVEGKFKNFIDSKSDPEGCCIASQEFYENNNNQGFKRGYTMQILRPQRPIETAQYLRKLKKLSFGKNFHNQYLQHYGHTIPIAIICEDLPELRNKVELDKNIKDSNNIHGVKISYKLSDNSKKILKHGISKAKELLLKAGAESVFGFGPVRYAGWHLMGTAKMGKNKKESVVNEFGQSHDIKNLVIVDSSIFVTSGAVNPMSTLQALALRNTEKIKSNPELYFS